jgi:hypothetical protein
LLKVTVAMVVLALAGSASAAGERSLRIDASSGAAFKQSLAAFKDELSPGQREAFGEALKDIWIAGTQDADTERRRYRKADYYRQIDGLSYEEVVGFTTGEAAKRRRQAAAAALRAAAAPTRAAPVTPRSSPWEGVPPPPPTWQPRGGTDLTGPGPSAQ